MNSRIILLGFAVAAFSSCSTAYKTGQTPDDVYFSPARETAAYVKVEKEENEYYQPARTERSETRYRNDEYVNSDDRWLRMRVRNRYRWSAFDDYEWNDYRYNSWSYNSYNSYTPFNNYWNNYYSWNSYYNPYNTRVILVSPKNNPVVYNRVRDFNLNGYSNNTYSNTNGSSRGKVMGRGTNNPGYNNNNSTLGNSVRRVFSNGNNNSGGRDTYVNPSSSDRPSRTYQPPASSSNSSSNSRSSGSSSSGSSSSGSSSGSGGVNRPTRN